MLGVDTDHGIIDMQWRPEWGYGGAYYLYMAAPYANTCMCIDLGIGIARQTLAGDALAARRPALRPEPLHPGQVASSGVVPCPAYSMCSAAERVIGIPRSGSDLRSKVLYARSATVQPYVCRVSSIVYNYSYTTYCSSLQAAPPDPETVRECKSCEYTVQL